MNIGCKFAIAPDVLSDSGAIKIILRAVLGQIAPKLTDKMKQEGITVEVKVKQGVSSV